MVLQMDDYKKQYEEELIFQEVASNKHTLKGIFWFVFAMVFVWFLTAIGFFEVDFVLTSIAAGLTTLLFLPTLLLFKSPLLSKSWVKYFLLSMICVVSGIIISTLTVHAVLLHVIPLLYAIQYRKRRVIWYTYAMNCVTLLVSCIMGFYYGVCDMNILFSSQKPYNWYMQQIAAGTLQMTLNENHLFVIVVFEVFPRAIILLTFTILMQFSVLSNSRDAARIANLTYLKETDIRTNLFNKNKYDEMLTEYYPKIEWVAVLFWDLNDLKTINDKYGHAVGDQAIRRLTTILHAYSNERIRTYRVGGDEFVMIIDNPKDEEAENIMMKAKAKLQKVNEQEELKIKSAVGLSKGVGKNIIEVIKAADKNMYENKKMMKERNL